MVETLPHIWKFVCPILILFILGFSLVDIQPVKYGNYEFPAWAPVVGWCLSLSSVSAIPIVMVLKVLKERGPIIERIKWLVRPASDFGPKHFRRSDSSDSDCNDECFRQIRILHNRKNNNDLRTLSDKHIDSQIPLASNFDDDEDDETMDDVYNNNVTNEQQKRLNKQYSIDYRSDGQVKDDTKKLSKKCMYDRQNINFNFISDDFWSPDDAGLHMKLNFNQTSHSDQLNTNKSDFKSTNLVPKFNETNF